MTSFGVLLVILGVGSLVLPYLNLNISLLDSFDQVQPWAGVIVAALGLITVLFSSRRRPEASATATVAAPAAAAEPASKPWSTDPPERVDDD